MYPTLSDFLRKWLLSGKPYLKKLSTKYFHLINFTPFQVSCKRGKNLVCSQIFGISGRQEAYRYFKEGTR